MKTPFTLEDVKEVAASRGAKVVYIAVGLLIAFVLLNRLVG